MAGDIRDRLLGVTINIPDTLHSGKPRACLSKEGGRAGWDRAPSSTLEHKGLEFRVETKRQ